MSPQELAEAQVQIANLQLWITGLAIFLGPLAGVLFTLWFQARREKNAAKQQLFITLMGERKGLKISPVMASALNTIDVVYSDSQRVRGLWHKYYSLLGQPPGEERGHTWLELLTAMAEELNYSQLKQTDLDKFYVPQGHVDELEFQRKAAEHWVRVLENTERFLVEPRDQDNKQKN
ncbi:DUF6680 family protein [Rheinheimera texasensis]|uniref:DUF6680 family protein n=1 Tax=Rheinheimera texasensis TaxID=306205 RepID=UPI0004E139C8|nr:DUF6680 family protein [Rheinheimera texasensis]